MSRSGASGQGRFSLRRAQWIAAAASWLVISAPAARADGFHLLTLDGAFIKWGTPHFDTGATVSYALLKANRSDPGAINCKAMTDLAALLGRSGLDLATFYERLKSALSMWRDAANIAFVPAASVATADIVIGAQVVPRGIAYTNIQHERVSGSKFARLRHATICLNPRLIWRSGGKQDGKAMTYELRRVLAHEIGHALGLDHPGSRGAMMGFAYDEKLNALTKGDIAGISRLYGSPASISAAVSLSSRSRR